MTDKRPKHILLILPDAKMHKLRLGSTVRSMREAPLTLASLAAMAPSDVPVEFTLVDGSVDAIPFDSDVDLVGISVMTGTALEAYRIADRFRARHIPVVLGGVHVTLCPAEAQQHGDAIVTGIAQWCWQDLLRDFCDGRLKSHYQEGPLDGPWMEGIPTPRLDLMRRSGYMVPHSVQATRGCSKQCDFCSVPAVWKRFQKRPVADVIRDIEAYPSRTIAFGDVNLIDDVDHAKELFTAMIPLRRRWGGLATTEVLRDPELLDLMTRSGCRFLLIGFESVNQSSLNRIAKGFNRQQQYQELVRCLHDHRISVQGCFVFGFDQDGNDVFDQTITQVHDLKIDIPRYSIYTPYPGTRLFQRLESERRILSYHWEDYDTMHVVFQPQQMSPEALYDGFKRAYRETFRLHRILQRTSSRGMTSVINGVGNLAYKLFVKRLYHDPRFAQPYTASHLRPQSIPIQEVPVACPM